MTITRRFGAVAALAAVATLVGLGSTLAFAIRRQAGATAVNASSETAEISPLAVELSAVDRTRAQQVIEKYRAARPRRASDHFHRWCFEARRAPYPVNKELQTDVRRVISQNGFRQTFRGSPPLFFRSPHGWEVRQRIPENVQQHWQYEHHLDQFLATCAEIGAPLGLTIESNFGPVTVGELLDASRRNFESNQELNWTLAAYCVYLPEEPEWTNRFGELCSYQSIVASILALSPDEGSCGGSHNQLAVAHFLNSPSAAGASSSLRRQCEDYLARASHLLEQTQLPNGAWTPLWAKDASEVAKANAIAISGDDLVRITGHHLEWISIAPATLRPSSACTARALQFLIAALQRANVATIEHDYCAYSHAAGVIECALLARRPTAIGELADVDISRNAKDFREGSSGEAQNP